MPLCNVQIMQGHTAAQKTALLQALSQSIVDSIGAPVASVRAVLQEVGPEDVIVAGQVGAPMARVDIALLHGRTEAQKAALLAAVNAAVSRSIGISDQAVRVVLHDVPTTDMGVAGGISAKAAGR
ncbi:tautomerase family protein [Bordetella sp. 2513F-2]